MNPINGNESNNSLGGTPGNDTINGFGGNDTLQGFDGADTLNGGANNDNLHGGAGADLLNGGSGFDAAIYFDGAFGRGVNVNLATGRAVDGFGFTDILSSIEAVAGTDFNDTMTGSNLADFLNGRAGNDSLSGGAGNDELLGNSGNDVLVGGVGADTLRGSSGADVFRYSAFAESSTNAAFRDIIPDFQPGAGGVVVDRIDLSAMDADTTVAGNQAFEFIGEAGRNNGFTDAGQVRIVTGALTFVQAEVNGDRIPDFEIVLQGNLTLTAGNFFL